MKEKVSRPARPAPLAGLLALMALLSAGAGVPAMVVFFTAPATARAQTPSRPDDRILTEALVQGITMGIPALSVAIGAGDSLAWQGTVGSSDMRRNILDYLDQEIVARIPNTDTATLRHLLNHQSGIPTWEFQADWIRRGRGAEMDLDHIWGKTETLQYCTRNLLPATNAPGQRYSYSNTNYTLLGLIIEAVTGREASVEIRRRILEPLGLRDTFLESFEDIPGGCVGHYHYATPRFQAVAGIHPDFVRIGPYLVESSAGNLSPEWTAGGIVSSAADLVRWARAIRDGELLGPAMQAEVVTWYPPAEGAGRRSRYLQGISRQEGFHDGLAAWGHSGGTLGFTAYMYWLEGTDIIVVMLANVGGMHSGLSPSPVSLFFRQVWLPAVMRWIENRPGRSDENRSSP